VIPIGDLTRRRRFPYVNYALILANLVVFIFMALLPSTPDATGAQAQEDFVKQTRGVCYGLRVPPTPIDRFYCRWGFQPREWFDAVRNTPVVRNFDRVAVLATILTAMFIHAGWLHLIGNMVFLWVFGDNVEDRLGHIPYLLFYVASGVVASLSQAWVDTASIIPNVGASGAVAGVLGAYLVWYARERVVIVIPIFPLFLIPIPVPALIMIGIWFAQQLLAGFATLGPSDGLDGGVAYFAHIGGFVFGLVIGLLVRAVTPRRPRPAPIWSG
jgi:membrane associated rhomboid family serine protease